MIELRQLHFALQVRASDWRRRHGASANEQLAMILLSTRGPCSPKELSEFVGVTTGGITTLVDRLERREWVQRTTMPDDRRRVLVGLTKAGMQAYLDLDHIYDLVDDLDGSPDHDTFRAFVTALCEALHDGGDDEDGGARSS